LLVLIRGSVLLKLPRLVECEGKWCEHPQYSRELASEDEWVMMPGRNRAGQNQKGPDAIRAFSETHKS